MSLLFQVLASGSKGNSILVCSPKTSIIIDAGLSGKELVRRMERSPVDPKRLDALVISHEHQDHVRGAGVLSRRFNLPVFLSRGTLQNLPVSVGNLSHSQVFQCGSGFNIGDLTLHPFAITHDASEPAGFIVEHEGFKLGVCTDLGIVTQLVRIRLQGCHGLVLEANHDPVRLKNGPYPLPLKQRISGSHGHLSNADTCELLKNVHHHHLKSVVFAHLSETNNHPDLVLETFRQHCSCLDWDGISVEVGNQYEVSCTFELP
jgi:phosphoribosyl 1,2-cyclic phosphodiesterase